MIIESIEKKEGGFG